jgi:hypothetical protein
LEIIENNIIELLDHGLNHVSLLRVLWISPDKKDVVVVDISDDKNMKYPFFKEYEELVNEINKGMSKVLHTDPDLRLISPAEEYLEKYKESRDSNWNVIKEIVIKEPDIYISDTRGKLVIMTAEETGKAKKEIYRWLKKYWFYGKTKNGLLRNYFNCGAPGEARNYTLKPGPKSKDGNSFVITDKDKKIFKKAIERFHIKEKKSLKATHQHMCEESYHSGYYRKHGVMVPIVEEEGKAPTLRQFKYWYYNNYSQKERYSNKYGKRKAEINMRALMGDPTERALGVGYLYEIDSTPADIILVSEDRETIIGTPTLYIVKDVFSRIIAGFHASLNPASSIEQMVALENAATNKVEFCRQYGIEIEESDWPCINLPQLLAGDRGELKGRLSENLVNLKVDVANAPSYRGDLKPFVERHFKLTNDQIRDLLFEVGAKPAKIKERGDFDPARNAALTIYEFTQFMILQIITYNKSALSEGYFVTKEMFQDKVELSPLGVWNWGKDKKLLHEVPRNLLRYNLLPKAKVNVTRWGIEHSDMCYTSENGLKDGWFEEEKIEGQKQVTICYDPRNVSSIFIRLRNGQLVQCFLTGKYKEFEGLHIEEVKTIMKYKKEEIRRKEKEEKQYQAELHAFSKKLVNDATNKTKEATSGISFNKRQKNKRDTKKSEGRAIGSKNAWTSSESPEKRNELSQTTDIISFPKEYQLGLASKKNEIQHLFSAKNKERRRDSEHME